jgi:hypothetical protein
LAIPVLIVLAVLWAAFFLWPFLQGRSSGSRADSIGDFSYRLGVIGKTGGHNRRRRSAPSPIPVAMPPAIPPARPLGAAGSAAVGSPRKMVAPTPIGMAPGGMTRSQRRRRDILLILGVGVLSSLLLALVAGNSLFWLVQGFADVVLVAYLALLLRMKQSQTEKRAKVHYLPGPATPASALVLRRSASS